MRRPIDLKNGVSIGQPFGAKEFDYSPYGLVGHHGQDYPSPVGQPIYAPESGTILQSANGVTDPKSGRFAAGETIVMSGKYEHWLMHLSKREVKAGDTVKEGQLIGYSGNTGLSTGPHLHWGTRPLNPNMNNGYRGFIDPSIVLNGTSSAGGDEVIPDQDNYYWRYNKAMQNIRGRQMTREEFRKNFVGRSHLTMLEAMLDNPEADKATDYQQWALTNRASIEKRVIDLQNMVADLDKKLKASSENVAALTKANEELNTKVKNLESQLAVQSEDTQLLNGFGEFLRKMIQRLGLK